LKTRETALSSFLAVHPQLAQESGSVATIGGTIRAENHLIVNANPGELAALELQASQLEEMISTAAAAKPLNPDTPTSPAQQTAALGRVHAEAALTQARRDLTDKRATFTDEHPDVRSAQRRVLEAEEDLGRAAAAEKAITVPAAAAANDHGVGSGRLASLRRALAAVRAQISGARTRSAPRPLTPLPAQGTVAVDTEWTRLFRDVSQARERQSQLESRQFQATLFATMAASGEAGKLVVVDPAFRPTRPVAGRWATTAALGVAGSLLLALLVMMAVALLDERIYSPDDIQRVLGGQFVIMVPSLLASDRKRLPPVARGEG
jgi:hypothetical protein